MREDDSKVLIRRILKYASSIDRLDLPRVGRGHKELMRAYLKYELIARRHIWNATLESVGILMKAWNEYLISDLFAEKQVQKSWWCSIAADLDRAGSVSELVFEDILSRPILRWIHVEGSSERNARGEWEDHRLQLFAKELQYGAPHHLSRKEQFDLVVLNRDCFFTKINEINRADPDGLRGHETIKSGQTKRVWNEMEFNFSKNQWHFFLCECLCDPVVELELGEVRCLESKQAYDGMSYGPPHRILEKARGLREKVALTNGVEVKSDVRLKRAL
jgi:hypothetical protein